MKSPIAWITGAGTGIGFALATKLIQEGYSVAVTGRRVDVIEEAKRKLNNLSPQAIVLALAGDASDSQAVERTYAVIRERLGIPDLLVNNAAGLIHRSTQEASADDFMQSFQGNCLSVILCTKAVLPDFLARGSGSLVNVSSIVGRWASPHTPAYSMTKYAVTGFTDSLRQELRKTPIHVMGVFPGYIQTPLTDPYASTNKRRLGVSADAMANAIYKGLMRRQREVSFPWYVPWAIGLHRLFPGMMEGIRARLEKDL